MKLTFTEQVLVARHCLGYFPIPYPVSFFLFSIFFWWGGGVVRQMQRMALLGILLESHYQFMHGPLCFILFLLFINLTFY